MMIQTNGTCEVTGQATQRLEHMDFPFCTGHEHVFLSSSANWSTMNMRLLLLIQGLLRNFIRQPICEGFQVLSG